MIRFDQAHKNDNNGLVLAGGGARAAYQIGMLKALYEAYGDGALPFSIISGMSAGAINGSVLAANADDFGRAIAHSEKLWRQISVEKVYRTGGWDMISSVYRLLYSLFHHGYGKQAVSILDTSPLWRYVQHHVNFNAIRSNIDAGHLSALGISASSYANGGSICFYEGDDSIKNWSHSRRYGLKAPLGPQHLIASCAIPMILPAVKIGRHYYGDGAMRQLSPMSSALNLGARKLMVIGLSNNSMTTPLAEPLEPSAHTPSFAGLFGQLFNSAFIDAFDADVEHLSRVNQLIAIAKNADPNVALGRFKSVDVFVCNPSQALDEITEKYFDRLPKSVRKLMNIMGASKKGDGSSMASYLMFDGGFCGELIDLGYQDGQDRTEMMQQFFGLET